MGMFKYILIITICFVAILGAKENYLKYEKSKHYEAIFSINKDGGKDGEIIWFYPSGKIKYITDYKNNKRDGHRYEFSEIGYLKRSITYKDDKKDGNYHEYFDDGNIKIRAYYKNGNLEGKYCIYNKKREVFVEALYENDVLKSGKVLDNKKYRSLTESELIRVDKGLPLNIDKQDENSKKRMTKSKKL